MKINLIYPAIAGTGFDSFAKTWDSENTLMPHGLALLASCCRQAGHEVEAIDLRRLAGWEHFDRVIAGDDADAYGLSAMSPDFRIAAECARRIRQLKPAVRIIIGGVHVSIEPQDGERNPDFDHVVRGEGELTLPKLLDDLQSGREVPRVLRGEPPDLDHLPLPDRDLFAYELGEMRFPLIPGFDPPFATVMVNRGCPFRCTFCQPAGRVVFGGKVRRRGLDSLFLELNHLRDRYHFRSLMIHDDLFIMLPREARAFADRYRAEGFTAPFICQARADILARNPEVVAALAQAGLRLVLVGFESGSQRILDFIRKGTTVQQNVEAVRVCRRAGVKIFANIMFGFPTETRDEVMATVEFVRWMQPDWLSSTFFTPFPGSELYDYCRKHDLSLLHDYHEFRRNPTGPKIKGVDYDFLNYALVKAREPQSRVELRYLQQFNASTDAGPVGQRYRQLLDTQIRLQHADQQVNYRAAPPSPFACLKMPALVQSRRAPVSMVACPGYDPSMIRQALTEALAPLGGMSAFVSRGSRVLLKPNLVGPYAPESQAVTHPLVIMAVATLVDAAGGQMVLGDAGGCVPPGPLDFRATLEGTGLLGLACPAAIEIVDLANESLCQIEHREGKSSTAIPLAETLRSVACVMNLPKLKTHRVAGFSGGIQNLIGLVPGAGRFCVAAGDGEGQAAALLRIAANACPQVTILDAVQVMEGDGPLAGTPAHGGFLAVSADPLSLDVCLAEKLQMATAEVPVLRAAERAGFSLSPVARVGNLAESNRPLPLVRPQAAPVLADWYSA